jgi:hypothetical protein
MVRLGNLKKKKAFRFSGFPLRASSSDQDLGKRGTEKISPQIEKAAPAQT